MSIEIKVPVLPESVAGDAVSPRVVRRFVRAFHRVLDRALEAVLRGVATEAVQPPHEHRTQAGRAAERQLPRHALRCRQRKRRRVE